jgi:hypothetical protein
MAYGLFRYIKAAQLRLSPLACSPRAGMPVFPGNPAWAARNGILAVRPNGVNNKGHTNSKGQKSQASPKVT